MQVDGEFQLGGGVLVALLNIAEELLLAGLLAPDAAMAMRSACTAYVTGKGILGQLVLTAGGGHMHAASALPCLESSVQCHAAAVRWTLWCGSHDVLVCSRLEAVLCMQSHLSE